MAKMISNIKSEIKYCIWLCVILSIGVLSCAANNYYSTWDAKIQNWEYNLDYHVPDGFSMAMIDPDKCN